jgi:hypothetical protein
MRRDELQVMIQKELGKFVGQKASDKLEKRMQDAVDDLCVDLRKKNMLPQAAGVLISGVDVGITGVGVVGLKCWRTEFIVDMWGVNAEPDAIPLGYMGDIQLYLIGQYFFARSSRFKVEKWHMTDKSDSILLHTMVKRAYDLGYRYEPQGIEIDLRH